MIDTTSLRGVLDLDASQGVVRVRAGTTLGELLSYLAAHNLTLPVVPGTRHVTVGGAIAADVHGKNHPRDGSFAGHVESLLLCTPGEGTLQIGPEQEPELFRATAGGMGLTGLVMEATLRVRPLRSLWVAANVDRTEDVEETLALMAGDAERHRYAIAWLDLIGVGRAHGRGVVTRSDDAHAVQPSPQGAHVDASEWAHVRSLSDRPRLSVPLGFPGGVLRPATVRAFNAWHWRTAARERERPLDMQANLFPLDAVGAWNRLYGPAGLVQYQFAVPRGQESTLLLAVEHLRGRRLPVYLATIKRFGPGSGGLLSFPLEGWTLAVDLPAGARGLHRALDELDELVAQAGGRVYLAKDARMRPHALATMYPQLERLRELRARLDPHGALRSDMTRRLGL